MKVPDPKTVVEIKKLSKEARGEVIHTLFNGLCTIRLQTELGLTKKTPPEEILEQFDKMAEWFRTEFKLLGFIGD